MSFVVPAKGWDTRLCSKPRVGAYLRVWTDPSAAIGICTRQGLGELCDLDTHTLWIQHAVRMGRVDLRKVLGEEHPADLLTKHGINCERLDKLVKLHGCGYRDGRSGLAPLARTGKSDRITMANAEKTAAEVSGNAKDSDGSGAVHGSGTLRECPHGSGSFIMQHLGFTSSGLDVAYPSIKAPVDGRLGDLAVDEHDKAF